MLTRADWDTDGSGTPWRAILATMFDSHRIRVRVHIHDKDEQPIAGFNPAHGGSRMLSGAVQVDTTADVSRSLSMVVLDSKRQLSFTKRNPAFIGVYADHFVSVTYGIFVTSENLNPNRLVYPGMNTFPGEDSSDTVELGTWIDFPVFWGPITAFEGNGAEVSIEAQGKESLGLAPNFYSRRAFHIDHKTLVHAAVHKLFDRLGETRYRLPQLHYKLGSRMNIGPESEPWKVLIGAETDSNGKPIGGLIERTGPHPHYAFYDARGRLAVEHLNKEVCFVFREPHILSDPQFSFDAKSFINNVVVTGGTPGKGKHPVKASVSLPPSHPGSPQSLSRGGEPRYMTHFAPPNGQLKTHKQCHDRAVHLLRHFSRYGVNVSADVLPTPFLEEHDHVAINYRNDYVEFALTQFTIPLTHDTPMSIGNNARVPNRRRKSNVTATNHPGQPGSSRGRKPKPTHHPGNGNGNRRKPTRVKPRHRPKPHHHRPRHRHRKP